MMEELIGNALIPYGLSRKYRGLPLLIAAVRLAIEDESRLLAVRCSLYVQVAEECRCPVYCVERNIRTLVMRAWKVNKDYMCEMSGYPMTEPPTVSEFIDIVAGYVQRTSLSKELPL